MRAVLTVKMTVTDGTRFGDIRTKTLEALEDAMAPAGALHGIATEVHVDEDVHIDTPRDVRDPT